MKLTKKITALFLALLFCLSMTPAVFADACQHDYEVGNITPATSERDGQIEYVCSICGDVQTEIIPRIGSVSLHASSVSFKGKAQKPDVIVKDINGNDINPEFYTITMATAYGADVPYGKAIGKYVVTVTFQGLYAGVSTLDFKIVPVAVENFSASASGPKSVTFSFDPVPDVKGYQIYYSKHKHGPYKKLATTTQTTYTYSKLKSGTTYYFKVRAYVGTRDGLIGGKFSGVRKVTVH